MCNFRSDGSEEVRLRRVCRRPSRTINPRISSDDRAFGCAAAALYGSDAPTAPSSSPRRRVSGRDHRHLSINTRCCRPSSCRSFQTRVRNGRSGFGPDTTSCRGARSFTKPQLPAATTRGGLFPDGVVSVPRRTFRPVRSVTDLPVGRCVNSRGIVPNNGYDRLQLHVARTIRPTSSYEKLLLDLGASYIIQRDRNMINQWRHSNPW